MANFVDFVDQNGTHYALSDKALIRFNLCKAIDPYPHDTWDINYKNFEYNWSEKFSFKTQEEAQAVYDLLRGKKDKEEPMGDGYRKYTDDQIEKQGERQAKWLRLFQENKEDSNKYLELAIEILKGYEDFVINLEGKVWGEISQSHWDKAVESIVRMQEILFPYRDKKENENFIRDKRTWMPKPKSPKLQEALSQLREEASKREPSIKDPDSIPIKIECGEFFEVPKGTDIKNTMELYYKYVKPLQDKLDRIRDCIDKSIIYDKGYHNIFRARDALIENLFEIKNILDEGEE